jgi:hypothetical protein
VHEANLLLDDLVAVLPVLHGLALEVEVLRVKILRKLPYATAGAEAGMMTPRSANRRV